MLFSSSRRTNIITGMMFLLVITMGSSLLHCSMDDFSKVNETRIKLVSSYPSGHGEVQCPAEKKNQ